MPTHLGANPRNHVNHDYSCSSLENFYYYILLHIYTLTITYNYASTFERMKAISNKVIIKILQGGTGVVINVIAWVRSQVCRHSPPHGY